MKSNKTEMERKGESQWIEEAQAGSSPAFDHLILQYQDRIYNAVYRLVGHSEDALDVVQETFIKAFCALKNFQGQSNFYTWIFRIGINTALTFVRKRDRKQMISLDLITRSKDEDKKREERDKKQKSPSELLEKKDVQFQIQQALLSLSDEYRIALILKDLEGLTYEEISEVLEIPKGTVKSRIFRAREALKEKLKDLML